MKKIFCFLLSIMMILSFAACGDDRNTTSGSGSDKVDENTVAIVNKAFAETDKALKAAKALGYEMNIVMDVTMDGKTTSTRSGNKLTFIKGDTLKTAYTMVLKNDAVDVEMFMYSDGSNTYGATDGITYKLVPTADENEVQLYLNKLPELVDFYDATKIAPIDTRIVNTSNGGYGFVLQYPVNELPDDFNVIFGENLDVFENAKGQSIKVSGIIDDKSRLQSQTVTYVFTYEYDSDITADVDPDNSEAVSTTTEKKTATVELSLQLAFNYGVTKVDMPDEIVVPKVDPDAESAEKLKEISLTDFQLLAATGSSDSDSDDE